jgi:hypothetical protein
MSLWPRSLQVFRASLLTALTEWKLARQRRGPGDQRRAFRHRVAQLHHASFWRLAGLQRGMSYERFRRRLPLRTSSELAPLIARMTAGEPDLLIRGRCALFIRSSGATTGEPQLRPLPEPMLAHFQRVWRDALLYHTVRARHAGIFNGRHLYLGGSSRLQRVSPDGAPESFATSLTGAIELGLPPWMQTHCHEPDPEIAALEDWESRLTATAQRTAHRDISLVVTAPANLRPLATAVAAADGPNRTLAATWPNWECWIHHGMDPAPYLADLATALAPDTRRHEVYAAPEGIFAIQDQDQATGLRLVTDGEIFFEFLPLDAYDPSRVDQLGPQAVPLAAAQVGVDYALIVTTPAGLVRQLVGDIIRFTSIQPPRLIVVGRLAHRLDLFGERVTEHDLTAALMNVCRARQWPLTEFHVAPLISRHLAGQNRGRHEWWIELEAGTTTNPTGPVLALELDRQLAQLCPGYAHQRRAGHLEAPFVRLVMPGVFLHWRKHRGILGGENKLLRCRSDRRIADELTALAQFAAD